MIAMVFGHGDVVGPFEYFCKACLQLRLSCVVSDKCANCGSSEIIKGACGSLDKDELTKKAMEKR
jgi:hypothetical protein